MKIIETLQIFNDFLLSELIGLAKFYYFSFTFLPNLDFFPSELYSFHCNTVCNHYLNNAFLIVQ